MAFSPYFQEAALWDPLLPIPDGSRVPSAQYASVDILSKESWVIPLNLVLSVERKKNSIGVFTHCWS